MEKIFVVNGVEYVADNMYIAYLQALHMQGINAVGANVSEKDGKAFMCHVCLDAFRKAFPQFTDNDFLEFEMVETRAWVEFPHVEKWTYEDYEETKVISLCDEGMHYVLNNSKLARYMEEIDFRW